LVWFENVKKYMALAPLPFAYKLMTRSKKIDYESLKKRDPQFIAAYDAAVVGGEQNANGSAQPS
jgi:anthraniloyl-CoA monooxygenase